MSDAGGVQVINIWVGDDGVSHFRDLEIDLEALSGALLAASPRAGGKISAPIAVKDARFRLAPGNQDTDFHCVPYRQLVLMLSGGASEITVGDGEVRTIGPGQIILVEDITGVGHKTRSLDHRERLSVFIRLE